MLTHGGLVQHQPLIHMFFLKMPTVAPLHGVRKMSSSVSVRKTGQEYMLPASAQESYNEAKGI